MRENVMKENRLVVSAKTEARDRAIESIFGIRDGTVSASQRTDGGLGIFAA